MRLPTSSNMTDLEAYPEWMARHLFPRPIFSRRCLTTSSAAVFWARKRTFFPLSMAFAMRFTIVWDFPVPGGPSTTRLIPVATSSTAECWELSAGKANAGASSPYSSESTSRASRRSWVPSSPITQEAIRSIASFSKRSGISSEGGMPVDRKMPTTILRRNFHSFSPCFLVYASNSSR